MHLPLISLHLPSLPLTFLLTFTPSRLHSLIRHLTALNRPDPPPPGILPHCCLKMHTDIWWRMGIRKPEKLLLHQGGTSYSNLLLTLICYCWLGLRGQNLLASVIKLGQLIWKGSTVWKGLSDGWAPWTTQAEWDTQNVTGRKQRSKARAKGVSWFVVYVTDTA